MCECGEVEEVGRGRGRGESVHGEKERKGMLTQYESVRVQCERMRTCCCIVVVRGIVLCLFVGHERDCFVLVCWS